MYTHWIDDSDSLKQINMSEIALNTKKGKLIVIEGTDGSGKKTQTAKLLERLIAQGADLASGDASLFVHMFRKIHHQARKLKN